MTELPPSTALGSTTDQVRVVSARGSGDDAIVDLVREDPRVLPGRVLLVERRGH